MVPPARLAGFKVLRDILRLSLRGPKEREGFPAGFCQAMAAQKINMNFFTCARDKGGWGLHTAVSIEDEKPLYALARGRFKDFSSSVERAAILSLFPHNFNPRIAGAFLDILHRHGASPMALASSNSAVSALLPETSVNDIVEALFEPFEFSAYRTPSDWKLAQKDKEELYKEVVASYQEKRPKVYVLEWHKGYELLQITLEREGLSPLSGDFNSLSDQGLSLTFLVTSPSSLQGRTNLFLCLPEASGSDFLKGVRSTPPGSAVLAGRTPAAYFSMNGPHFGDRYGIAGEILAAFDSMRVPLLGLACSIASITGVVPADHVDRASEAIQACFEVPSIIEKTPSIPDHG